MRKWTPYTVFLIVFVGLFETFGHESGFIEPFDMARAPQQDQDDTFPARCSAVCGFTLDHQPLHCLHTLNNTEHFCVDHQYQCNFVYTRNWGEHTVGDRCIHRQRNETGMCPMHQTRGHDVAAIAENRARHAKHEAERRLWVSWATRQRWVRAHQPRVVFCTSTAMMSWYDMNTNMHI